jgi:hypothetical protein
MQIQELLGGLAEIRYDDKAQLFDQETGNTILEFIISQGKDIIDFNHKTFEIYACLEGHHAIIYLAKDNLKNNLIIKIQNKTVLFYEYGKEVDKGTFDKLLSS